MCFNDSYFATFYLHSNTCSDPRALLESDRIRRRIRAAAPLPASNTDAATHDARPTVHPAESRVDRTPQRLASGRLRALTNWDPSYPKEHTDWYGEYVARHAPVSLSWLQQPSRTLHNGKGTYDIKGLGYHTNSSGSRVIAPLEDGSVCIWDISEAGREDGLGEQPRGAIRACSRPGLLYYPESHTEVESVFASSGPDMTSTAVTECVSIDSIRNKAYFAVDKSLKEVDLETLLVTACEQTTNPISALSKVNYPVPLTVGTTRSLYLHDPRRARNSGRDGSNCEDRVESTTANFPASSRPRTDFHRLFSGDQTPDHAPLFQPGPLSILHLYSNGCEDASNGEIYVGGRFPSILVYDRRCFPKLQNTIHSGARICSLASLPNPFRSLEVDFMRQNKLGVQTVQDYKSQAGSTLIACGEYNGKGSLEMYGVSSAPNATDLSSDAHVSISQESIYKNRVSASSSKLLSIATHGTRLVFSDSNGELKWVERDGSTLVRRWNINKYEPEQVRGIFNNRVTCGDVARKILVTDKNIQTGRVGDDELLIWTGEKIGLLSFKSKPEFGVEDWEAKEKSAEEGIKSREERIYSETMRRALERQANEVRFVRALGFGR